MELTPQLDGWDILPEGERENLELKCLRTALNPKFSVLEANNSLIQRHKGKPFLCFTLKTIKKATFALSGD